MKKNRLLAILALMVASDGILPALWAQLAAKTPSAGNRKEQ